MTDPGQGRALDETQRWERVPPLPEAPREPEVRRRRDPLWQVLGPRHRRGAGHRRPGPAAVRRLRGLRDRPAQRASGRASSPSRSTRQWDAAPRAGAGAPIAPRGRRRAASRSPSCTSRGSGEDWAAGGPGGHRRGPAHAGAGPLRRDGAARPAGQRRRSPATGWARARRSWTPTSCGPATRSSSRPPTAGSSTACSATRPAATSPPTRAASPGSRSSRPTDVDVIAPMPNAPRRGRPPAPT